MLMSATQPELEPPATSLAATNKTNKYCQLSSTHIFTIVAIETAGTWHHQAEELGHAGDHHHRRLKRDHLPVQPVISGLAKVELKRSLLRTCSQSACLLLTRYLLFSSFNV